MSLKNNEDKHGVLHNFKNFSVCKNLIKLTKISQENIKKLASRIKEESFRVVKQQA